jgi:hypothetical protein
VRSRPAALAIGVVVAAGAVSAWRAGVFSSSGSAGTGLVAPASATAMVTRQELTATTPLAATLGYAGSFSVRGLGGGTLTWLPSAGRVIRQGQVLYRTDLTSPVPLLYGRVPAWRTLDEGVTGADVTQLNHDLVALGDVARATIAALGWDYFSWATQAGVQKLQSATGIAYPTGSLSLGQVVFEPEALRVSQVTGILGGLATGPVLQATTDRHHVTIPLDASQETAVKAGDRVTVTLPDGNAVPGVVSSIGTVARTVTSGSDGGPVTTIPVQVRLTEPKTAGSLDQAPVTVNVTTASSHGPVLAVPVGALLARSPAQYVVEVAGPGNSRRWVPVRVGIFDDATGLVQVSGALAPGQRVVVPVS